MKKYIGMIALCVGVALAVPFTAVAGHKKDETSPSASPSASPGESPAAATADKAHPFPKGAIISIDKNEKTFTMGKKKVRKVHVTSETKIFKEDKPATFDDLAVGMEITGSVHKRADGDVDAISIYIGGKHAASPEASPSSSPAESPAK